MGNELVITLPDWLDDVVRGVAAPFTDDDGRMALAVALARENVERSGGPFGAAVFAGSRFVAGGVNRVLDTGYSIAHAEIVALMNAQRLLAAEPTLTERPLTLATSAEPCCQCFGAIVWSGIDRLVCAATTADVEAIGFDEGPKPANWPARLEERGIRVLEEVLRAPSVAVLQEYGRRGGVIYGLRPTAVE